MSESYKHVVKGGLKLKGGAGLPTAGGVKKKKKKKKDKELGEVRGPRRPPPPRAPTPSPPPRHPESDDANPFPLRARARAERRRRSGFPRWRTGERRRSGGTTSRWRSSRRRSWRRWRARAIATKSPTSTPTSRSSASTTTSRRSGPGNDDNARRERSDARSCDSRPSRSLARTKPVVPSPWTRPPAPDSISPGVAAVR